MIRIRNLLLLLRGQLWIVPAIISALGLALAYYLLRYGATLFPRDPDIWWLYSGDADSARQVLSSLLSGLMTMTSLVVSITFVILTLSANQLGPRLITTFTADRQIQTVLGLFLGTILYVLVVLRTLDNELGREAVPHIAVTGGSALTVVCLFALLFYVHKVARSVIADNVVGAVARALNRNIRDILPEGERSGWDRGAPHDAVAASSIALGRRGFVQTVDYDRLLKFASTKQLVVKINVRAGHFVLREGEHVNVHSEGALKDTDRAAIIDAFTIGQERTPAQDPEYGIRQLVEIGVRALSPGINDPFTAIVVLDRLGGALEEILSRGPQANLFKDRDGHVRVIADRSDINGLLNAAFDMIREAGSRSPAILIRMADLLGQLAPLLRGSANARKAVLQQLDKLTETVGLGRLTAHDHRDVCTRIEAARAVLHRGARPVETHHSRT